MSAVVTLIIAAVAMSAVMGAAWLVQRATGNNGWADVFWSFGVGAVGVLAVLISGDMVSFARKYLVVALLAAWSVRLGGHIFARTRKSRDDPRYAKMRKEWGAAADQRMFFFLQSQAFAGIMLIICIYIAAARPDADLEFPDYIGALIMLVALVGEAIADWQLRRFGSNPANRGRICDTGLWRWSRHPNYFFEWLGWTSYVLIAADFDGDYLHGWLTLAAPVLMYVLLRHVSGVPPLEEHMIASRGNAFRDYQRRTSVFFPAPPRS
jgi:steroid 5-alpha reductase family enzyme